MTRLDSTKTAVDPGDSGDGTGSARALSAEWYSYLGLRLRLQQGELPEVRSANRGGEVGGR